MLLREGHEAAAQEAFEEAGVRGEIGTEAIGTFRYRKRRRLLPSMNAEVRVFALRVDRVFQKWPEAHERQRQWFTRKEAAAAVAESGLKRLILGFEP